MKIILLSVLGLVISVTVTLFLALSVAASRGDEAVESDDGAESDSKSKKI